MQDGGAQLVQSRLRISSFLFPPRGDRVLTVDDHPLVRQGIGGLLGVQSGMTLVAEGENGRDAVQQFRQHRPDVTLMDIQMPEMNGIEALIAIRTEFPDARVIMLTTSRGTFTSGVR